MTPPDFQDTQVPRELEPFSADMPEVGSELIVAVDPMTTAAETFRDLRSVLNLSDRRRGVKRQALAVVSPNCRDGRTFVAANLAVAYSQLGRKTLFIDADMRRPRAHTCFNVSNETGLSEMLAGRVKGNLIERVGELPNVYVLPVGRVPDNPLELAESGALDTLITDLCQLFDQVIVDTPAVEFGGDARVISSKCGSVLAVCRKGRTRQPELQSMVRWLQTGPSHLAGMIMNGYGG